MMEDTESYSLESESQSSELYIEASSDSDQYVFAFFVIYFRSLDATSSDTSLEEKIGPVGSNLSDTYTSSTSK